MLHVRMIANEGAIHRLHRFAVDGQLDRQSLEEWMIKMTLNFEIIVLPDAIGVLFVNSVGLLEEFVARIKGTQCIYEPSNLRQPLTPRMVRELEPGMSSH